MVSSVADYRLAARRRLSRLAFDYLDGGAEDGDALRRNIDAYKAVAFQTARAQGRVDLFDGDAVFRT